MQILQAQMLRLSVASVAASTYLSLIVPVSFKCDQVVYWFFAAGCNAVQGSDTTMLKKAEMAATKKMPCRPWATAATCTVEDQPGWATPCYTSSSADATCISSVIILLLCFAHQQQLRMFPHFFYRSPECFKIWNPIFTPLRNRVSIQLAHG